MEVKRSGQFGDFGKIGDWWKRGMRKKVVSRITPSDGHIAPPSWSLLRVGGAMTDTKGTDFKWFVLHMPLKSTSCIGSWGRINDLTHISYWEQCLAPHKLLSLLLLPVLAHVGEVTRCGSQECGLWKQLHLTLNPGSGISTTIYYLPTISF